MMIDDPKTSLLIVDDEQDTLDALAEELSEENYLIRTARSEDEAFALLKTKPNRYQIILSNVKMSDDKDAGLKLAQSVHKAWRHIPFILMSGVIEREDFFQVFRASHAIDLISKPWDIDKLKAVLAKAAEQARREAPLIYVRSSVPQHRQINKPLPLCIKQIVIEGFQSVKSVQISDIPTDTRWIFLTGENGTGKTVLLQALVIGMLGAEEAFPLLRTSGPQCKISVEYLQGTESKITNFRLKDEQWPVIRPKPKNFLAYGVSRLAISNIDIKDECTNVSTLLQERGSLNNIERLLKNERDEARDKGDLNSAERLKNVTQALLDLLPNITAIQIEGKDIIYLENGCEVPLAHFSTGNKSMMAMIGDILTRLFDLQPEAVHPNQLEGIVIIDELDCHLHPKWQAELPDKLTRFFPKVQFIANSHSPLPIIGMPEESIFLKVKRNAEGGTVVERIDIDPKNLLPNHFLTSPLFGLEKLIPLQNECPNDVRTEDSYSEVKESMAIEAEAAAKSFDDKLKDRLSSGLDEARP